VITGLPGKDSSVGEDAVIFHAGTAAKDGQTVTSGGRVLCVTALAESVKSAQQLAYDVAQDIGFAGMQYRKDIGHKAIKS
jgi:phosphoribosylamine---glycine ligase